jgi:hypothetical protein
MKKKLEFLLKSRSLTPKEKFCWEIQISPWKKKVLLSDKCLPKKIQRFYQHVKV